MKLSFNVLVLWVCLGIAGVLGTNTAYAQISFEVELDPRRENYLEGSEITVTFTALVSDSAPADEADVVVSEKSYIDILEVVTGTEVVKDAQYKTDGGVLALKVRYVGAPTLARPPNGTIRGDWDNTEPKIYAKATIQGFRVPPEESALIVVHPPMKDGVAADRLAVGSTFTQEIEINRATDLAAWQIDVAFNPNVLEVVGVTEGDFLEGGGLDAFFYDNANGTIQLSQTRIDRTYDATTGDAVLAPLGQDGGSNGDGTLVTIEFKLLEFAEEALGLHNVQLSNSEGERGHYSVLIHPVVATDMFPDEDVNRDGMVNILDLTAVAQSLGQANPINPRADVNDDGIVNALDLVTVAKNLGKSTPATTVRDPNQDVEPKDVPLILAAPATNVANLRHETIQGWIDIAQVEDDGSAIFDLGIASLERLLQATVPEKTKLLLNYPNPFNPETWIPYQLAKATDVTVSIYSVNGTLVRTLALGHQSAGVYQSKSQAAYWDGRNELGEQVASGVYFYTLTAGDFSATGKMLVRK